MSDSFSEAAERETRVPSDHILAANHDTRRIFTGYYNELLFELFSSLCLPWSQRVFSIEIIQPLKNMMKSVSLKLSDISAPSGPQNDRRGPESERSSAMIPDIFRILDQQHLHRPIRSKKASVWQRNKRCLDPTSAQPQFPRDSLLRILKGEASELTGFYLPTGNLTAPPSLQPAADKLKERPEKG